MERSTQSGRSLLELLAALAVTAAVLGMTLPPLADARHAAGLAAASMEISGMILRCRLQAVTRATAVGLVFDRGDDGWEAFVAVDGDCDGIRSRDLATGRDRRVGRTLHFRRGGAGPGILVGVGVPDPSGRGMLGGDLADPIRCGRGDILTFTSRGTATPASIYLSDGHRRMRVLRIYGATAKVHQMTWRIGQEAWRPIGS